MRNNKLLIFDLDGTLLDTLEDLKNSVNFALRSHNYPERSLEQIRNSVGNGFGRLVSTSLPSYASDYEDVLKTAKTHYRQNFCIFTHPYEGIMPLLDRLNKTGYDLAIVSNKPDEMIQSLHQIFFSSVIPYATGEIEGVPRKPAPQPVYHAMEHFGVRKEQTVYIGDSEVDYETALNAGVQPLIVNWGFRTAAELLLAGITDTVENVTQLMERILHYE